MSETDRGPFRLCGYVPLNENGFALPAYAAHPGANAWYAAISDIDGDHLARIRCFELLEDEDVLSLPDTGIEVSVGDPWQDVFLWNGRAYAGTPRQILHSVEAWRDDLEAIVPISFLDLLLAAEAPTASKLSASVLSFLTTQLGDALAADTFQETVLRPGILLEIRRHLHRHDPKLELASSARSFSVTEGLPGSFHVELAHGTSALLGGDVSADELSASIGRLGDLLGISVRTVGLAAAPDKSHAELENAPAVPQPKRPQHPFEQAGSTKRIPNILVIASDRRAAQIARYFEPPGEMAFGSDAIWDTGRYKVEKTGAAGDPMLRDGDAIFHVSDGVSTSAALDGYDLVVWLAGNETLQDESAHERIGRLARAAGRAPFLLAPAPPSDGPSFLSDPEGLSRRLLRECSAVIDTTVARSPFWAGQPRRSIDRRIADIVVTVALAAVLDDRLRQSLRRGRGAKRPTALTFIGAGEFTVERSTASELNAAGLFEGTRERSDGEHVQFELRDKSDARFRNAFIELQPLREDFERFARAAVAEALGPGGRWRDISSLRFEIPPSVRQTLDHPALACAIPPPTIEGRSVIVTAETPDLTALREATVSGVAIARYTDTGTIRTLLDGSRARFDLPVEIRIPRLHRYPRNRGLATRGVDARDVIRMSETRWRELHDAYPQSELAGQERRYLAAIDTRGIDSDLVLPVPAVWNAVNAGDALARQIVELQPKFKEERKIEGKRIGDLIAAWSWPADDVKRWVIEDGRIPVELSVLEFGEVPAQRLFQIDGDGAVPVFLMSRIFAVWARALLPSSTSWASRFQVSKTFDAFPFPLGLSVRPGEGESPPQLRLSRSEPRWNAMAEQLGDEAPALAELVEERGRDEIHLRRHPLMWEIDRLLLEEFELSREATDLDILERLVERNRQHD
ncbi:hypothetical protein DBIPINDM_001889 [Mesorhizobium sp. AR02]|uniref:hypothetical protein n=1 Tax=Mesorhizobium sp. AR02 TaxID=2865837 RepID=UPI002160F2E7|nr:hypothetical protein [Mesorhizobium sp. AR02]UVK55381.1 hypothetical protein DBIPINDM_001889 [Mesorhizobium sp. AR02]